jgi:hypothetical protein
MSADAKVWYDESGWSWRGLHDGECRPSALEHRQQLSLSELVMGIEQCMGGRPMRWEIRQYPDGRSGLVGYTT